MKTVDDWLHNHYELPLDPNQEHTYAEMCATPFHLLPETLRWELLYAIQRRDLELQAKMVPVLFRRAYLALRHSEHSTLVGLEALGLQIPHANVAGVFRDLQMWIDEAYRRWRGLGTERGLYFLRDLDLTPSVARVSRQARIDLRELRNGWWLDCLHSYILEAGPHGRSRLSMVTQIAEIVDDVLVQRDASVETLGRADADAIVRTIRKRWPNEAIQRKHLATFRGLLAFGRTNSEHLTAWRRISPHFEVDLVRHRAIGAPDRGRRKSDSYRFIPQPVVDWLMDHISLLSMATPYRTAQARMILYMHERCGRRPSETARLRDNCISYDSAGQAYLEWDKSKQPFGAGPRLPIHQDVHNAVRQWQQIKKDNGVESEWLFPSLRTRRDDPISGNFILDRIRDLVRVVKEHAPYENEVEGADGNLIFFDLDTIDAYAFRHAFAQRHADATDEHGRSTISPEVLQEWMGHLSFDTTMGYFVITARRKRHALSALPARRLNMLGDPVSVDRERDGFTKIAVSLGSCTEPMNVAAGGHACALEHACETCPFFLVDPFEKDGIVAKRTYLLAQIERVQIIAPDSHMIDHYKRRVEDCSRIIAGIDRYVMSLPPDEQTTITRAIERMADIRRRATAQRRIDLREIMAEHP